mgnify:FL=1
MRQRRRQNLLRFFAAPRRILTAEAMKMQVKSFVLTMGAGVAIGALGAMMLPKSSPVYHAAKDAANTIRSEAEKAMQSMAN